MLLDYEMTSFSLRPLAPFRLDLTAWALRRRPANTVGMWDGETYRRVLAVRDKPILVAVTQQGTALDVALTGDDLSPEDRQDANSLSNEAGAFLGGIPWKIAEPAGIAQCSEDARRANGDHIRIDHHVG
jgi:hypothetical protein